MNSSLRWRSLCSFGQGCVLKIPRFANDRGFRRVLVVAGSHSFSASGADQILQSFDNRTEVRTWQNFSPNPTFDELVDGLDLVWDFRPEVICGIGGGTAMDLAKLLGLFGTPVDNLLAMINGSFELPTTSINTVLAPTTAGSGSEATHFAVIYVNGVKHSIEHESMYASHVFLDPSLVLSSDNRQRATSGLDAICQAIESLWAVRSSEISRKYAKRALSLLLPNIRLFAVEGRSEVASRLLLGAHLSGRAIDETRTTAPHALSYYLTDKFGISHGFAVATTLSAFMSAHFAASAESDADDEFRRAMEHLLEAFACTDSLSAVKKFESLMEDLRKVTASNFDITQPQVDVAEWLGSVNLARMRNNPIQFSEDELAEILKQSSSRLIY